MEDYGYFRIRAQVPQVKIADPEFNISQILQLTQQAHADGVDCIVFPELSVSSYSCADLFEQKIISKGIQKYILQLAQQTENLDLIMAVGAPVEAFGKRYNAAIVISNGKILGIVPKSYLPNYGEFYEKRWFVSGKNIKYTDLDFGGTKVPFGTDLIFKYGNARIGVEICEDLWVPAPPSGNLAMAGANVILNLSASDDTIGKYDYLLSLISQQSARCRCVYAYASAGWGESSTDLVFSGKAFIGYDGKVSGNSERFATSPVSHTLDVDLQKLDLDRVKFTTFTETEQSALSYRIIEANKSSCHQSALPEDLNIDPYPFVPTNPLRLNERCEEIINIQSFGLMKRLDAIGCKKAVVGISGGLDSTLAILVTVRAFDKLGLPRTGILGVTMPGLATTSRTKNNAHELMDLLGVTSMEIPINEAIKVHFKDINQDPELFDATYENSQARERTQIIMDLANKIGGIVIGTGDMSELALGWCTYNGDQMSMYGVNASVPKTLVRHLVNWFAQKESPEISRTLKDICDTPISPELVPSASSDEIGQKTEDLVGPYELHDFFLYHFLRNSFSPSKIFVLALNAFDKKYTEETILKWLKVFIKRFFSQQFKRSCMPDGPKVGSVNLSPRGDWRMPSDASPDFWLKELDNFVSHARH